MKDINPIRLKQGEGRALRRSFLCGLRTVWSPEDIFKP